MGALASQRDGVTPYLVVRFRVAAERSCGQLPSSRVPVRARPQITPEERKPVMEPRDYIMLGLLVGIAVVGSAILVYVLRNLDKENGNGSSSEQGGGHGHE